MASDSSADVNLVELLSFLRQYQWVHDVHLTKLFEHRVLDSMPVEVSNAGLFVASIFLCSPHAIMFGMSNQD